MVNRLLKKVKGENKYIRPSTGRKVNIGGPSHKKDIENIEVSHAGNKIYVINDHKFITPTSTVYNLAKKYRNQGYEVKNGLALKSDFERVSVKKPGIRTNGIFGIATYNLKMDDDENFIDNEYEDTIINNKSLRKNLNNERKILHKFYKELVNSRIFLYTDKDKERYISEDDEYFLNSNNTVILRFHSGNGFGIEETNFISVPLDTFGKFMKKIRKVTSDQPGEGSDGMLAGFNLDMTWFQLRFVDPNRGGGEKGMKSIDSKVYKNKNYSSIEGKNNCLVGCVKLAGFEKKKSKFKEIRKQWKEKLDIPIDELVTIEHIKKLEKYYKKTIGVVQECGTLYNFNYRKNDDLQVMSDFDMLVLQKDNHYSLITGVKYKVEKVKKDNKKNYKVKYVYWDCETIFDRKDDDFLKPYMVAWFVTNNQVDWKYDKSVHDKECHIEFGRKCMDKFLQFIVSAESDIKYKLIGFNSSKFDNFFLASRAAENGFLGDVLYVNNSFLNLFIDRHDTLDIIRMTGPTKLKDACKSYKTNPVKVDGFDHNIPQKAYDDEGWKTLREWYEENKEKADEYIRNDVLCLCDLTNKLNSAVNEMTGIKVFDKMTIGQLIFDHMKNEIVKNFSVKNAAEIIPRPETCKIDKFVRDAMFGGRTQAFHGQVKYEGYEFNMVDCTSLYPYVMFEKEFPIGKMYETKTYIKKHLGIYRCKISHQNAKWLKGKPKLEKGLEELDEPYAPCLIPKRSKKDPLDWAYRGEMEVNLSNVDIEMIKKYCGDDAIEVFEGYYWKKSSDKLFSDVLSPFKNEKIKQDKLKDKNSDKYNPAKREFSKLAQNSLSGKVGQRNFSEYIQKVKCDEDVKKFFTKVEKNSLEEICNVGGTVFLKGNQTEEDAYKKSAKPSYLSVFIYSYARKHMYEKILSRYCVLYQDTDSALMPRKEYLRFREEQKELDTKEYGGFKEEVGVSKNIVIVAPKTYLVTAENEEKSKRKCKGIRKDDTWLYSKEIKNVDKLKSTDIEKLKKKARPCMNDEFFNAIYSEKPIIVLTSQLRKVMDFCVKNDAFTTESRIGIKQIFMTKQFNVDI